MTNLATCFDNLTFEAVQVSWTSLVGNNPPYNGFERSADFFKDGSFSGKLTRDGGWGQKIGFNFPAQVGKTYKFEINIRTTGERDNTVFMLYPAFNDDVYDYNTVRGKKSNTGWRKLYVVFTCKGVLSGESVVYLQILNKNNDSNFGSTQVPLSIYNSFTLDIAPDANSAFVYADSGNVDVYSAAANDPQFGGRKLYYVENVFLLSDGTNLYEIEEPIGWDKILINITFDKLIKGFKFEFTDKDVTLDFDESSGMSILKNIYNTQGVDGVAGLKFGERDGAGVLTILYEARIVFDQFTIGKYTVKAYCERQSLAVKFSSRFDTKFELEQTTTLSGVAISALAKKSTFLHSRNVQLLAKAAYDSFVSTSEAIPVLNEGLSFFSFVPPLKFSSNETELVEPLTPDGNMLYAGYNISTGIPFKQITFDIIVSISLQVANNSGGVHLGIIMYTLPNIARSPRQPNVPTNFLTSDRAIFTEYDYPQIPSSAEYPHTFHLQGSLKLGRDEAVFFKAYYRYDSGTTGGAASNLMYVNTNNWKATFFDTTPKFPILFQGYRLFDVVNRMLNITTDVALSFKSDLLDTGCMKDHIAASGKQVRSIPRSKLTTSMRDMITSLDALLNVGFSFERDNNGNEWGRLEPTEYFFQDVELLKLNTISNYSKRPANEYIFNELEFGFAKFPQDNQASSADDYMTKFNFITRIKTFKNKLSKICQFIMSPLYIQYTLENSIQYNVNGQYETDNDTFLISCNANSTSVSLEANFDSVKKEIAIIGILPVVAGESITISNSSSNNGTFRVAQSYVDPSVTIAVRSVLVLTTPIVAESFNNVTFTYTPRYVPKRDEQFEQIQNVYSPVTAYNLEHHLKRILLRWSNLFLSGVHNFLGVGEIAKFMSGSNNTALATKLKNTETCSYGESTPYQLLKDSDNVSISKLNKPLFKSNYISFDAQLTWQTLNLIRTAFEGRHPDDKNYGYLVVTNPDSIQEKVFILDLKFNPVTQSAKFLTIEKYDG